MAGSFRNTLQDRLRRASLSGAVLLGAGCASPPPPLILPPESASAPSVVAPPGPVDTGAPEADPPPDPRIEADLALARDWLVKQAVTDEDFARRELYTWTSATQVEEMKRSGQLLVRNKSKKGQIALFDRLLDEHPEPLFSRALHKAPLAMRRFAWPHAWATAMGYQGESYGDRLVRVVLKPDAIVGSYDSHRSPPWRFVDLKGSPLTDAEAAAHVDKLGAVYHAFTAEDVEWSGVERGAYRLGPYREFVLCNESMIEEWSVGSPESTKKFDDDVRAIAVLREVVARAKLPLETRSIFDPARRATWKRRDPKADLRALWDSAVALPDGNFSFDVAHVDLIGQKLERVFPSEPVFRHAPTARFEGLRMDVLARTPPPAPAPKLVPKCRGTMCY